MSEKERRIDPNSRDYDFKKDIDVDPRFKVCLKELLISFGVFVVFAAVMLLVVFVVGGGFAAAEGNLLNWLRLCLPSGGVSLTGAMMDELTGLRFLWIGDFVTWSPYVMLTATAVQIPIWFALTVRAYRRHGS